MTNFERTLRVIREQLSNRLLVGYRKIWVLGSNRPGETTILFIIFPEGHGEYIMEFVKVRNFRQFRPDGNLEEEMNIINRHIDSFQSTLQNYITY